MKQKLTVVTFNLRMDTRSDGENYFFNRANFIRETIVSQKPDLLCFQEATPRILKWLKETLADYTVVGCGRGADLSGEANPIAYRTDRFELFSLDQFWLSPSPYTPGSRYKKQSSCPRICMSALLHPLGSNRLIRVCNTHLDHISEAARKQGMKQILKKMAADDRHHAVPKLLTGDMNARPTEACIKAAKASGLTDFTESILGSFHDFGRERSDKKIDYIFGAGCKCLAVRVWNMQKEGLWLSDHYPLCCEVVFE